MSVVQPNVYTLSGGNVTFTFHRNNFLGGPFVTYSDPTESKSFFGSAVRVQDVGIGTLVTVTTHMTIDAGGTEFSVLLPLIELPSATATQNFSTDGVATRYAGPDSFPVTGVRETYDFIPMTGSARFQRIFPLAAAA